MRNLTTNYILSKIESNIDSYNNSNSLLERIKSGKEYDFLIVDLQLDFGDGFEILDSQKSLVNKSKIIIHTSNKDAGVIKHCIELGANAIVSKSSNEQELLNSIIVLENETTYYCPKITSILNNSRRSIYDLDEPEKALSIREREVLKLMWENRSSEEISSLLSISYYTVETHRKSIKKKLGGNSLIETLRIALDKGYIDSFSRYSK
ncbi:MAG: response regulator transcription factor [Romboutsia sp.]|nr:response regulator transcription factor [Romboutsia sp.]